MDKRIILIMDDGVQVDVTPSYPGGSDIPQSELIDKVHDTFVAAGLVVRKIPQLKS